MNNSENCTCSSITNKDCVEHDESIIQLIVKEYEKAYSLDQIKDINDISDVIIRRTYEQLFEVKGTLHLIIKNALKDTRFKHLVEDSFFKTNV